MLAQHQEVKAVTKVLVEHQCMNRMGNQGIYFVT